MISVVMTVYNEVEYLYLTLLGYNKQTFKDFEVIIGDDGSSDDVLNMLKKKQNEFNFPWVYYWQKDEGFRPGEIYNRCVRMAKYDIILATHHDCIPHPRLLEIHAEAWKKNPDARFQGHRVLITGENIKKITPENLNPDFLRKLASHEDFRDRPGGKVAWANYNCSFRKDHFLKVGGCPEKGQEDHILHYRLDNIGVKAIALPHEALVFHLGIPRIWKIKQGLIPNDLRP